MTTRMMFFLLVFCCFGCSSVSKFQHQINSHLPEHKDEYLYKQARIQVKQMLKLLKTDLKNSNHIIYYFIPQDQTVSNSNFSGVVYDATHSKSYYHSLYKGEVSLLPIIDEETKSEVTYVLNHYINRNLTYLRLAGENCQLELQFTGKQKNIMNCAITEVNLHSDNTFFFSFPALVFKNGKPLVDAVPLKARL